MALPPDIPKVQVNLGPWLDFMGRPLKGSSTVEPSTSVLHLATGTPILAKPETVDWDVDGTATIALPATDSPGLNVTSFKYRFTHRTFDSSVPNPEAKLVDLPASAPVVDLDLTVPSTAPNGIVVDQPAVTSVAGLTGAPNAQQLVDALQVPLGAAFVPREEYAASGAADALHVLVYSGSAYPTRPAVPAGQVRYVGPSQPTTWLSNDEWVNNS